VGRVGYIIALARGAVSLARAFALCFARMKQEAVAVSWDLGTPWNSRNNGFQGDNMLHGGTRNNRGISGVRLCAREASQDHRAVLNIDPSS
jgi:hypothetical protein